MVLLRQTWLLLQTDLRQELRSLELALTSGFFSLVLLALVGLAFTGTAFTQAQDSIALSWLWLSIAFVGVLTLTRLFDGEREADTLRALLVAPIHRLAIFLAKIATSFLVLSLCSIVLVPGLALFFAPARVFLTRPFATAVLLSLGIFGYVVVGTFFAAGLATSRGKNVFISLILLPLTTPVLMYNLLATRALLVHHPSFATYLWRLAALDLIVFAVCAWLFEIVLVGHPTSHPRAYPSTKA